MHFHGVLKKKENNFFLIKVPVFRVGGGFFKNLSPLRRKPNWQTTILFLEFQLKLILRNSKVQFRSLFYSAANEFNDAFVRNAQFTMRGQEKKSAPNKIECYVCILQIYSQVCFNAVTDLSAILFAPSQDVVGSPKSSCPPQPLVWAFTPQNVEG